MQGQRLHLSIYHTDSASQIYLCSPSLPSPPLSLFFSVSLLFSAHPFYSSLLYLRPFLTYLSIHPSIFCLHPSISHSWHPPRPISLSLSLSLFVSFSLKLSLSASSSPPALPVRTQQKCPEGLSFKHRNQKHMAHFQLPRSITAIYPEIAAKFPKVSSRFTTDCNVCLSHFENQATFPSLLPAPCNFPSTISKAFQVAFRHFLSPLIARTHLFFASTLFGPSAARHVTLISCKLEISPDPSK